ncbi:procyclic acidic repetitive family protein [Corynebacterium sp. CCM 9185]|uniref:Uncharacterized protein n=1 Tax=Corynebacterium marambiense TaxID=2765364 RepID=A0ABS0VXQ1_9CORY|nr:hypothetical protein [Corynebacterium marambiense]MBI9001552.1 hypothetical protein [Corynebacterium marambiense]MCK7663925.1 procyclic acidic repetitive family protein [Corynebacterium marambiense]MCX7543259.1 hypothetical protein [Corynebacterium marambiense]
MTPPRGRHARNDDDVVAPAPVVRLDTESFRVPTGAEFIAISHGAPTTSSWPPPTPGGKPATTPTGLPRPEPTDLFRQKVNSHRDTVRNTPARSLTPPAEPEPPVSPGPVADTQPEPTRRRHHRAARPGRAFFSLWRLPSGTEAYLLRPTAQRQLSYWLVATFLCCVALGIGLALLIHGLTDNIRNNVHTGCLLSTVALCLFFWASAFLRPGDVLR